MTITLPKASQLLDLAIKNSSPSLFPDFLDSLIYGKQCIDRVQEGRQKEMQFCRKLLPFEISGRYDQ